MHKPLEWTAEIIDELGTSSKAWSGPDYALLLSTSIFIQTSKPYSPAWHGQSLTIAQAISDSVVLISEGPRFSHSHTTAFTMGARIPLSFSLLAHLGDNGLSMTRNDAYACGH